MALDTSTLTTLQEAVDSVEEWRDKEVARLEQEAAFLKRVRVPVSSLSSGPSDQATDDAETFVNSLLGA